MHLAALPPIYVSGTSRTNFGNNRTGSDRMSTGYHHPLTPLQPPPWGDSRRCPVPLATGSVANATHTPASAVCFYHSFSLYSSTSSLPNPTPFPFHLSNVLLPSPLHVPSLFFYFGISRRCTLLANRGNAARYGTLSNFHILYGRSQKCGLTLTIAARKTEYGCSRWIDFGFGGRARG